MNHIRIDDQKQYQFRKFACGIGPHLPIGDQYCYQTDTDQYHLVDCRACKLALALDEPVKQHGTPASELSGRPGFPGYEKFKAIMRSWGFD